MDFLAGIVKMTLQGFYTAKEHRTMLRTVFDARRGKYFHNAAPAFLALAVAFGSTGATAGLVSNENCEINGTTTFTLNQINLASKDGDGNLVDAGSVWSASGPPSVGDITTGAYTSCLGSFDGNDNNPFGSGNDGKPTNNRGEFEDGLLNYADFDSLLSEGQEKLDISGDGNRIDPGWLRIAEIDWGEGRNYDTFFDGTELGNLVEFTMDLSSSGNWSVKLDPAIVEIAQALGKDAFDHLALVVKQANSTGQGNTDLPGGFAVYDFNFQALFDSNELAQDVAYNFYGGFDLAGISGDDFSHVTLWARDPETSSTDVVSPAPLLLIGLGLLSLVARAGGRPRAASAQGPRTPS